MAKILKDTYDLEIYEIPIKQYLGLKGNIKIMIMETLHNRFFGIPLKQ